MGGVLGSHGERGDGAGHEPPAVRRVRHVRKEREQREIRQHRTHEQAARQAHRGGQQVRAPQLERDERAREAHHHTRRAHHVLVPGERTAEHRPRRRRRRDEHGPHRADLALEQATEREESERVGREVRQTRMEELCCHQPPGLVREAEQAPVLAGGPQQRHEPRERMERDAHQRQHQTDPRLHAAGLALVERLLAHPAPLAVRQRGQPLSQPARELARGVGQGEVGARQEDAPALGAEPQPSRADGDVDQLAVGREALRAARRMGEAGRVQLDDPAAAQRDALLADRVGGGAAHGLAARASASAPPATGSAACRPGR